jgi:CDP-diacylglycerol--serine O-phosphatidyltransferase
MLRLLSVADFISITNAILGILAVLILVSNVIVDPVLRLRVSFSLVLLALLADGLDGIIARMLGKSDLGGYLESMADMTSMVIAPAVFIYFIYSMDLAGSFYRVAYLFFALVLFLFFGIVRLASFNVMKKKGLFVGLPASASTIILIVIAYLHVDFIFILPAVIIIGAAMASDIRFPKPGVRVNSIATVLIFLTLVFDKTFYGIIPVLLLVAILLYSVGGPCYIHKKI